MEIPLSIDAQHVTLTEDIDELIHRKADWLERYYQPVVRCHVVVEGPSPHHRTGGVYGVRLTVTVPGAELAVSRHESTDLSTAVHKAFDAARRQLQDHVRQQRDPRSHPPQPEGRIVRLLPEKGQGFLRTRDGREILFQRNGVLEPGFDSLRVGAAVHFIESVGETGLRANSVKVVEHV